MPPVHGSKAYFAVQDAGGVSRDLSAFMDDSGMSRSADTAEVTTGGVGVTSKKYIPGLKDGTIPLGGPWDSVVDGYLDGILGVERNFIYRPAGTGTTLVEYTGACIETSYEPSTPVDGRADFSAEFQVTGNVTRILQA